MSQTVSPAGLDVDALARHLTEFVAPMAGPLQAELLNGGRSNLTYRVTDGVVRWVLRRRPVGDILPGSHDMSREYRVLSALRGSSVPVPPVVHWCPDESVIGAPFYLMEEVDGVVLGTLEQIEALLPAQRASLSRAMVDTLVDLHQLDHREVGLSDLGRPDGYLERQLDRWVRQYHAVKVRPLPQVDRIAAILSAAIPRNPVSAIIHGDFRLDNVMVDRAELERIRAVLDWEMATLGDPLADLATLVMFWDEKGRPPNPITAGLTAFEGFFDRAAVVERYVARMELAVDDVDWYLVFVQFRLAVILEQIHARDLAGDAPAGDRPVRSMVPRLLESALEDIARSPRLRDQGNSWG